MATIEERKAIDEAMTTLVEVGFFNTRFVTTHLTHGELVEIARDKTGRSMVDVKDGWMVVLSSETLVAKLLRRIAGVLGVVPHHETLPALMRCIDGMKPEASEFFEARPTVNCLKALLSFLECEHDDEKADFSTLEEAIYPTEKEGNIINALHLALDCNLNTASLVRRAGMSGRRTSFLEKILPTTPFLGGGTNGQPVRLLGYAPDPALHRKDDKPLYVGMDASLDGNRVLLEYRLTEEAVETASFNVAADAKEAVHGTYLNEAVGNHIKFNMHGRDARKLTGLRTAILRQFPDYVTGQRCFVKLDKVNARAEVVVLDGTDYEGREQIKAWLDHDMSSENRLAS